MAEINDDEMFSMSYKDARDKYAVGVGNNKYFMSESDFNEGKERINKKNAEKQAAPNKEEKPEQKKQSLVAQKFGNPNSKTYDDVLRENGNDPAKMADWMNNNPGYKAGSRTKKGMEGFGYIQGTDGKWAPKPKTETTTPASETKTTETNAETKTTGTTADDSITELEKMAAENEALKKKIEELQNSDGSIKEEEANRFKDEYMKRGLEMGAVTLDKDGNYVFTNTNKKGWEDWATMLSVGASVIGLAMGVPIMPINFRKITNKDEKDAKIREFQKQYNDILAGNAAKVEDVKSSKEAGDYIKQNQGSIDAFTNYAENIAAYKAKSDIDTDSEKDLIETRTDAQIKADEARFNNEMKRIKADQDFNLKVEALREQYKEQFAALESALMTGSTKELLKYQNGEMFKEMEEMGVTPSKLATWKAAQNSISPADKVFNKINTGVNTVIKLAGTFLGKGKK